MPFGGMGKVMKKMDENIYIERLCSWEPRNFISTGIMGEQGIVQVSSITFPDQYMIK